MAPEGGFEDLTLDPDANNTPAEDLPAALTPEVYLSVRRAGSTPEDAIRYHKVRKLLETVPWEFQFFQAVRLLEHLQPERVQVGQFAPPSREAVRFAATPRMAFPASQVNALTFRENAPPLMQVNFLGMTGPLGVLPLYYTELIMERLRQKDTTLAAFLDLFNHRMVSLFYQAWEKYRVTALYEKSSRDRFSAILQDLIGIGTPHLSDRQIAWTPGQTWPVGILDDTLLFYSGLLGLHTRPAAALRQILWDYFNVPVEIEQLVGAWHPLEQNNLCRFEKANTYSEQVGMGAIVGDEIWDQQSGVRIRLGPLNLKQYLDFLPTGSAYEPLRTLLRFYSGWEIDFEVQLVLKRDEVPGCELGNEGDEGPKLGWVSWSKNKAMICDPDDTVLQV